MSKESRAARKEKILAERDRIKRTRKLYGYWASMKLACKIDYENFKAMSWWAKPLYILRLIVFLPVTLAILLVMLAGIAIIGVLVFITENFWKCFAVFCLVIAIFVLVNLGVL